MVRERGLAREWELVRERGESEGERTRDSDGETLKPVPNDPKRRQDSCTCQFYDSVAESFYGHPSIFCTDTYIYTLEVRIYFTETRT